MMDSDDECGETFIIYTACEILLQGLDIFFTKEISNRVAGDPLSSETNTQRFKDHYGCNSLVVAQIWEDLQITENSEARLIAEPNDIRTLLESLHFLYRYKTEFNQESTFDKSPKTFRKKAWDLLEKFKPSKWRKSCSHLESQTTFG
jgi:hypothetical protein